MGPGLLPRTVPPEVYRVWRFRHRIEIEAADQFQRLAATLKTFRGSTDSVVKLAEQAALDELRHEVLCRQILRTSAEPVDVLRPQLGLRLGPVHLNAKQRALYACVAMGCVTETLSTILLVEMRRRAQKGLIRETVHEILEDEVKHSQIGWAELARCAEEGDVRWLGQYVPAMIRDALAEEVLPLSQQMQTDLSPWGILPRSEARSLMTETVNRVILPGLNRFGVQPESGQK